MKKLLILAGCIIAMAVEAAVLQSGWTSTTNPATARAAMGAAGLTNSQTFSGANVLSNQANTISGNGAGLTNLNASNLVSGTVADARLSTNAPLKNANNVFTGSNTLSGATGTNAVVVAGFGSAYYNGIYVWDSSQANPDWRYTNAADVNLRIITDGSEWELTDGTNSLQYYVVRTDGSGPNVGTWLVDPIGTPPGDEPAGTVEIYNTPLVILGNTTVHGRVTADRFTGDGSALTGFKTNIFVQTSTLLVRQETNDAGNITVIDSTNRVVLSGYFDIIALWDDGGYATLPGHVDVSCLEATKGQYCQGQGVQTTNHYFQITLNNDGAGHGTIQVNQASPGQSACTYLITAFGTNLPALANTGTNEAALAYTMPFITESLINSAAAYQALRFKLTDGNGNAGVSVISAPTENVTEGVQIGGDDAPYHFKGASYSTLGTDASEISGTLSITNETSDLHVFLHGGTNVTLYFSNAIPVFSFGTFTTPVAFRILINQYLEGTNMSGVISP